MYNRRELVVPTLESVRAQTWGNWELIVVDDGSTDGTADFVAQQYPEAQLIRKQNAGPGAARNDGARVAIGRYLAFLDSDDLWLPWTLQTVAAVVQAFDDLAMIGLAPISFAELDELDAVPSPSGPPEVVVSEDLLAADTPLGWMGSSVPIFRRSDYLAVGGYPDRRMNQEDVDLWIRMGTRARFADIHTPVLYARRVHQGNVSWNRELDWLGTQTVFEHERKGIYPGGKARRNDRLQLITAVLRAASIRAIRAPEAQRAWSIYSRSFLWNLQQRRWRYLLGFPLRSLVSLVRRDALRLGARTLQE